MGETDNLLILFTNLGSNGPNVGMDGLNSIFKHLREVACNWAVR